MVRTFPTKCICGEISELDTLLSYDRNWRVMRKCKKCKAECIYVLPTEELGCLIEEPIIGVKK